MIDPLRARIADAVDTLSDLDTWLEVRGGHLPPLLLAKALVRLDAITVRLARLRQALAAGPADFGPARLPGTRQRSDNATGEAS